MTTVPPMVKFCRDLPEAVGPRLQQPEHHEEQPGGGQDRPGQVEPRLGPGPGRVGDLAGEPDDPRHDQDLQAERVTPAERAGHQPADQRPGRGAQPARTADHAEVAGPRLDVGEGDGDQDVDGRDHQRRAHALQQRVPDDQLRESLRQRRQQAADGVDAQADHEAAFAAPDVGQLAARDHQRRHREGEQRDRRLHPGHGRAQVCGDRADRHVHVRGRVTGDELRQRQRQNHRPGRRARLRRIRVSHRGPSPRQRLPTRRRRRAPAGAHEPPSTSARAHDASARLPPLAAICACTVRSTFPWVFQHRS